MYTDNAAFFIFLYGYADGFDWYATASFSVFCIYFETSLRRFYVCYQFICISHTCLRYSSEADLLLNNLKRRYRRMEEGFYFFPGMPLPTPLRRRPPPTPSRRRPPRAPLLPQTGDCAGCICDVFSRGRRGRGPAGSG